MAGIPTTPDGLHKIIDLDSPDIPRDLNMLADTTQAALVARAAEAQAAVASVAARTPPIIVLSATAPVPPGTAVGTVIVRTI